jgi:glycosyltransferase involved in cell wall biosynthesis
VLEAFPIASETFIANEIAFLRARGINVRIIALRASDARPTPSGDADLVIPPIRSPALWWNASRFLRRSPRRTAAVLREAWALRTSDPHGLAGVLRWAVAAAATAALAPPPTPDLVHAHFGTAPATLARLLATALARPWGVSVHARDIYVGAEDIGIRLGTATHVIACSEPARRAISSRLPPAARPRTHVVHHGVDLERWSPSGRRPDPRELLAPPLLLAAGRFVPKKGFDTFLESLAVLRAAGVAFRALLVGRGPEEAALRGLLGRLELTEQVRILPWLDHEQLRQTLQSAAAVAVPSRRAADGDRDNIPNVLVEALACGVPVVASPEVALHDELREAEAALLVPPDQPRAWASALARVLADHELAQRLAAAGRRVAVLRFDERESVSRLVEIFAASADQRPPPFPRGNNHHGRAQGFTAAG